MKNNKNYLIGLDIGSNSIGWAATDSDYNFLRLKGKTAFGSRIFTEAQNCKDRRVFRSNRRRAQRRKYRIYLLNQLFGEEISKVDKSFFARLQNSTLTLDDKEKKNIGKNLLFQDRSLEKEFYKEYPTIWHLRKRLYDGDEKALADVRNVYLALHHIIKYRGNFLSEGEISVKKFNFSLFERLNELLKEIAAEEGEELDNDILSSDNYKKILDVLLDEKYNKPQKKKALIGLFAKDCIKEYIELFCTLISGGSYSLSKIIDGSDVSISFEDDKDNVVEDSISALSEKGELIVIAKQVYDHVLLKKLIGDKETLSEAMVDIYEQHKKDLKLLKKTLIGIDEKNGNHSLYELVFKNKNRDENYPAFVHNNTNKARPSIHKFNAFILKILDDNKALIDNDTYDYLSKKASNDKLLIIIANMSTSVIPHQLHLIELKKIIENASKKYSFIGEIEDKLIKLFTFRVPYYFGPLDDRSKYSNVVRNENKTITPWNVNEIVDFNRTKEKFINKLTNNCSYLYTKGVLPKSSLIIEDYQIYDRLNVLQINGNLVNDELKESLYKFITSRKKTTVANLKSYIKAKEGIKGIILFSKIKEDVPFEASSHAQLGKCFDIEKDKEMLERCILLATIYADDKKGYIEEVINEFPTLNDEQIKCIRGITAKKWSRFSKELLTELFYIDNNGVAWSILSLLKSTNKNFQMIMFDEEYKFNELIAEKNKELSGNKTNKEVIEEMIEGVPAITRRSINQALLVVDDVIKAAKCEPAKILVEVTRNEEKKKAEKDSRYDELNKFLDELLKDTKNVYLSQIKKVKEELKDPSLVDNMKLKGKHLYLYFKQIGLDMYTGEPISIDAVLNSNKYDTDHIIPQCLIKDDSLDNLVLVDRNFNQKIKGDTYPLPIENMDMSKVKPLWEYLFKKKSISEKKYNNLMRTSDISLEEIEQFVNRQINVVDYANVTLINILKMKYPNTKIIFSKAHYPSFLRKTLEIIKNRNLNDAHHAIDAYLNIVCGNILTIRYSNVRQIYDEKKDKENRTFNMEKALMIEIKKKNLGNKIKENAFRTDALVTYKTDYNNGAFYNETIYKAGEKASLIPVHTNNEMSDTSKYGGYLSLYSSGMSLVKYFKKGKEHRVLMTRKTMLDCQIKDEKEYLLKALGNVDNPEVICNIPLNQKVEFDGGIYLLITYNEEQNKLKQAYQNYIDNEILKYIDIANKSLKDIKDDDKEYVVKGKKGKIRLIISRKKNAEYFEYLKNISFKKVYDSCNYIVRVRDIEGIDKFNIKQQIDILNQLINVYSRNADGNCKLRDYFEKVGNPLFRISKDITSRSIKLINESPSGLFVTKKDLHGI